jgi:hypothetical protein
MKRVLSFFFAPGAAVAGGMRDEVDLEYWWRDAVLAACDDALSDVLEEFRRRTIDRDDARRRIRAIKDFLG